MTCKDTKKPQTLLNHLKNHTIRVCQKCQIEMKIADGSLPFGDALLTTWVCSHCHQEEITIVQENGKVLELAS